MGLFISSIGFEIGSEFVNELRWAALRSWTKLAYTDLDSRIAVENASSIVLQATDQIGTADGRLESSLPVLAASYTAYDRGKHATCSQFCRLLFAE